MAHKNIISEPYVEVRNYSDPLTRKAHLVVINLRTKKLVGPYDGKFLQSIRAALEATFSKFTLEITISEGAMMLELRNTIEHEDRK